MQIPKTCDYRTTMEHNNKSNSIKNTLQPYDNLDNLLTDHLLDDLRLAVIRNHLEGVKKVLKKGIAVNQTLKGGWSPLMYACSMGHPEIVKYLLQEGANPNFHKELFTSLMAACASTRENEDKLVCCIDLLNQYSANLNAHERHRISALMFAAKEGHQKLVTRLCELKCNMDLQDSQGWTALFWAVNQGKTKVVMILVHEGANVSLKDRRGHTALDLAVTKGNEDIVTILTTKDISKELINISDLENISDLCRLEKKRESLFNSLLDELMNAENNNGRYGSTCLSNSDIDKTLQILKEKHQLPQLEKNFFQNNWLNGNNNSEPFIRNGIKKNETEIYTKNILYSIIEAEQVLSHVIRHLSTVIASVSYVRLRVQAHPVNTLLEDKYAKITEMNKLTEKALNQAYLLTSELKFLHHYGQKLEETDKVIPADLLIEKKEATNSGKFVTIAIVTAAVIVIFFNNRFKISLFI